MLGRKKKATKGDLKSLEKRLEKIMSTSDEVLMLLEKVNGTIDREPSAPSKLKEMAPSVSTRFEARPSAKAKSKDFTFRHTKIDRIMDILDGGDFKSVDSIAKEMKERKEDVAKWCAVLEKHGAVKVEYPVIGKPVVKSTKAIVKTEPVSNGRRMISCSIGLPDSKKFDVGGM